MIKSNSCVFISYLLSIFIFFCGFTVEVQSEPQQIFFVKAYKSSQQCPNNTAYALCKTFDYYYNNMSFWCKPNTEMLFEEGIHYLDDFIQVSNCHTFSMTGVGNTSQYRNIQPKPSSKIICQTTSKRNNGLYFYESTGIRVSNLEFESCGGSPDLKTEKKHALLTSALAFVSVKNLIIEQTVIENAMGYGLFVEKSIGKIKVTNSMFLRAKSHPYADWSGNAKFSFHGTSNVSTTLVVNSSWFMHGENSSRTVMAGGLNVYINGTTNVHVTIFNVTVKGNAGTNGNLALYLIQNVMRYGSTIVINNSRIEDGNGSKGGGLRFWSYISQSHDKNITSYNPSTHHIVLKVINTVFQNNSVKKTGGAMYIGYYNSATIREYDGILRIVNITNCNFTENSGNGAAIEIVQHNTPPHRPLPLFQTFIKNCHFDRNFKPMNVDGPILDLISVDVTISNSTFTRNNATVMTLRNTYLNLHNDILFANNSAVIGGALKLCDSSLIFGYTGTKVTFVNNTAKKGGAIYIQQSCMDTSPICFFQPSSPQTTPLEVFGKHMNLTFNNNSAQIAGHDIYGGDLDRCSTLVPYTVNDTRERFNYLLFPKIMEKVFHMQGPSRPSRITSNPLQSCFCQESGTTYYEQNHKMPCITEREPIEVYPGELFSVSAVTVGQMNSWTYGTINATLKDEHPQYHTLVRIDHLKPSLECTKLTFALNSNMNSAQIYFNVITSVLATRYNVTVAKLNVTILQCPLGFQLQETPPYTCVCNTQLNRHLQEDTKSSNPIVTCDVTSQVISAPAGRMWIGCFDPKFQNDSASCKRLVMTPNCNYYCSKSLDHDVINFSISDLDSQCSPNHTGVMCGACKNGYSRILGNIFECRKDCTNTNLIFLIPFFLVSGFLLVFVIMVLNLTVSEGTLNGLLVYTMAIQNHSSYFTELPSGYNQFCWIFVSWINLMFGIRICFYKGMDGYQYTWILFAQAFYYIFIQVLIILLTRRFNIFTRLFGRNIVKVLATIFVLLYSNLLYAVSITFQFAKMHYSTPNGTLPTNLAWYFDGNVPYLGLKHAPLFFVALFCSIVMTFFGVSLLMIQCFQRQSSLWCCRWIIRLRPFYDAFTGPCRDSYRFWPGFLLFIRVGLFVMNSAIPADNGLLIQIKLLMTAVICVLVMSLACIFPHGVYKRWPLNVLEFSFFLNLCITSGFEGINIYSHKKYYAVNTSVSIAAMTFVCILIYHSHNQIKKTKIWSQATTWLSVQRKRLPLSYISRWKRSRKLEEFEDTDTDERDHLLPQSLPPVVRFEDFREPLVET